MKKIPSEIYVSQEDLEDRLNIDGGINTAFLFAKPIEGVQMTRYVNNEAKWHEVISKDDVPHCDRYNEVVIIAFGIHKEKGAIFSRDKVCYWKVHNDRVTLRDDIRGLWNAPEFGDICWAHVKDFFPKFNK